MRIFIVCWLLFLSLSSVAFAAAQNSNALFRGEPYIHIKSGIGGCAIPAGNGVADDATAMQCVLDYVNTNFGGGTVYLGQGNYRITVGLVVKGATVLVGDTIGVTSITVSGDISAVTFDDAKCTRGAGAKNMFLVGYQNVAATKGTLVGALNCPMIVRDMYIWFGKWGIDTSSVDAVFENIFACGYDASVHSTGANWYIRNKFDTCGFASVQGFFQGPRNAGLPVTVMENHFIQSDFSGSFTYSINVDDGGEVSAMTVLEGSVFSSPINIAAAKVTIISAGEIGSTSLVSASPIIVTGSYAFAATTVTGAGSRSCAANINITC